MNCVLVQIAIHILYLEFNFYRYIKQLMPYQHHKIKLAYAKFLLVFPSVIMWTQHFIYQTHRRDFMVLSFVVIIFLLRYFANGKSIKNIKRKIYSSFPQTACKRLPTKRINIKMYQWMIGSLPLTSNKNNLNKSFFISDFGGTKMLIVCMRIIRN